MAMNEVNGKCRFSESVNSEILGRIFKKKLQSSLCHRPHLTCKSWVQSVQRGRVCPCVKLSPSGVYFFTFLGLILFATGRPIGPSNAINGPNDAGWWLLHSLYGLNNENSYFPYFKPKIRKIALRPTATLLVMFFRRQISELPRPIAAKLRHMIGICVCCFINWLQKFRELSP